MPVIADTDEPPTKCCKYCDESTHGVDGPVSWRLTLDQDLIDTLKGSFPNWFPSSPVNNNSNNSNSITTASSSASSSSSSSSTSVLSSDDTNCLTKTTTTTTTATLQVIEKSYQGNIIHETFDGMAEGDRVSNSSASTGSSILGIGDGYDPRQSPPKAIVDSSPLQPAMDKNKESLKVKLMVRRPITTLVEQGIIPPLKTSPAIHEQCKQLERAKTGDLLKAKIQQRPDRQELERRHILEHDEIHVDPSLAEKQRMLKKARLADQLNSQISHRPGPLELIKKNILHTEKPIERIVKEGLVSFKATSEGLLTRPQQPNSYITFEDDSQSSEGDTRTSPPRTDVLEAAAASAGIVTVALTIPTSGGAVVVTSAPVLQTKFHPALITTPYVPPPPPPPPPSLIKSGEHIQVKQDTSNLFAELCQSVTGTSPSPTFLPLAASPASLGSSTSTLSPLSSVSSPPQSLTPRPVQSPLQQVQSQSQKSDAPGKDKNRKKNKSKPVSKARTIKFHEYKGPPNAQKSSSIDANQTTEETSYQLMLEQQNCLLRFLEKLNKNQAILPATTKNGNASIDTCTQSMPAHPPPLPSPALSVSSSIPPSPAPSFAESTSSDITKLEKMKVSDLKLQLKKRNLPVSGPKPQLIERLKPYLPLDSMDTSTQEPISCNETSNQETVNSPRHSMSPESDHEHMDVQHADSPRPMMVTINDSLVREQQRKIDELQRQLERSQQELQQIRQNQHIVEQPPPPPINQKMVVKQQLEAKIQKQQAKNQALLKSKTPALIAPKEEKPQQPQQVANQISMQPKPNNVGIVWNGEHPTLLLVGLQDKKLVNGHQRAASLPSIVFPISTTHNVEQVIDTKPIIQPQPMVTNVTETIPQIQVDIKPPPLYEEATKQLSTIVIKQEPTTKKHVKSENLTDVLDILIKNGDLPESALDPTTPTTPGSVVMVPGLIFDNDGNNIAQPNRPSQQQRQQPHRQQPQRNTKAPSVSLEEDDSTFNASLLLNGPQSIQNIDMASPLQPECHIDSESAAKTIDIFLEQDVAPTNGDINHFDDLELMELMSQQLDMDIGDETCHGFPLMESNQQQKPNLNIRRDMNPSLQPSLNELIQQQNNNNIHNNNNNNHNNCNGIINGFNSNSFGLSNNTNNNYSSTPMDVCDDFENPLGSFDFSNLSQDSNINTPPHPFSSELSTPTPVAGSSGSEHHNNNPLSHNSLSMPLGSGCGGNNHHQITTNSSSSSCSNSNNVLVGGGGSCCGNASSGMHLLNGTDNDTFDSHMPINQDNILDLFNIDDYKMTWGEVDFAV